MQLLFVLLLCALFIIVFIVGLRVLDFWAEKEWNEFLGLIVGAGVLFVLDVLVCAIFWVLGFL